MCLYTGQLFPFIALRDRKVYKVINNDNVSQHFDFPYAPDTGYSADMEVRKRYYARTLFPKYTVNAGFHAYRSLKTAMRGLYGHRKVVEMTIPKGARYYLGDANEIVSNKLVTGDLKAL